MTHIHGLLTLFWLSENLDVNSERLVVVSRFIFHHKTVTVWNCLLALDILSDRLLDYSEDGMICFTNSVFISSIGFFHLYTKSPVTAVPLSSVCVMGHSNLHNAPEGIYYYRWIWRNLVLRRNFPS